VFGRLLALFLLVPLAELAILVLIGREVGIVPTLGLVVVTALAGSWLLKREGAGVFRRIQSQLAAGKLPGRELMDGAIVLVAGVLLLTPGVLTDVFGLIGLLPPTRAVVRRYLERRMRAGLASGKLRVQVSGMAGGFMGGFAAGGPSQRGAAPTPVEDAEVIEERRVEGRDRA